MTRPGGLHVDNGLVGLCVVLAIVAIAISRRRHSVLSGNRTRSLADWPGHVLAAALWTLAALGVLAALPVLSPDPQDGGSCVGNDLVGGLIELMIVAVWACVSLSIVMAAFVFMSVRPGHAPE